MWDDINARLKADGYVVVDGIFEIDEIIKQEHRIKSISNELNKLYEMKLSLYKKLFQSLLQEDFNHE